MAIHEEEAIIGQTIKPDSQDSLIYMKLGFIGPKTLEAVGNLPNEALQLFRGHFIIGNFTELRAQLHKLVDQACDNHEEARKQNG